MGLRDVEPLEFGPGAAMNVQAVAQEIGSYFSRGTSI